MELFRPTNNDEFLKCHRAALDQIVKWFSMPCDIATNHRNESAESADKKND